MSDRFSSSTSFSNNNVTIAIGQGEYITDQYEPGVYRFGDLLYCSPNGKITRNSRLGNVSVGVVGLVEERRVGFISYFGQAGHIFEGPYPEKEQGFPARRIVKKKSRYQLLIEESK